MKKDKVKARAIAGSHVFGVASTGTEQVGMRLSVIDGPRAGEEFVWYGSFTENSVEITLSGLKAAGWDGSDFANLPGLGSVDCMLTLQEEERRDSGALYWRAAFINPIGIAMKEQLDAAGVAALAKRVARLTGANAAAAKKVPF